MANFYTDSHGPDREALLMALAQLKHQAQATNGTAAVFLMAKTDLRHHLLGDLIGEQERKQLEKTGTANVAGMTLRLLTATAGREAARFRGPVLAPHVTSDALKSLGGASDIVFVPLMEEDLAAVLSDGDWAKISRA